MYGHAKPGEHSVQLSAPALEYFPAKQLTGKKLVDAQYDPAGHLI